MADDDTLNAPVEEGHVSEPEEQAAEPQEQETEGQTEQQEQAPPQPPPPKQLTPEEIEERAFQRAASWLGRREAENTDKILRRVAEIVEPIRRTQQPAEPAIDGGSILDNPEAVIERVIDKVATKRSAAENLYANELVRHAVRIMDSNTLFKKDRTLGEEVAKEVIENAKSINKSLPPDVAADLLISKSHLNVVTRHANARINPLASNRPQKGIGTVTAPVTPKETPKPIKMDAETKRIAEMFGNTDDEIRKYLG
jgi:hypothetical protein